MESQHVDLMRFSPELNPKMEPLPHESYRGIDCQAQNDNTIWHQPWSKTFGDIMEKALEGTSFLRPQKPTTAQEEIFDLLGTADVFTPPKTASETLKFETQPENRLSSVFLTPPSSAPRKPSNPNGFERTRYLFDINENTMYQKVEIPLATGQQPSDSFTPPKDGDVLLHQILENPTPASNELGSNGVSLSSRFVKYPKHDIKIRVESCTIIFFQHLPIIRKLHQRLSYGEDCFRNTAHLEPPSRTHTAINTTLWRTDWRNICKLLVSWRLHLPAYVSTKVSALIIIKL